MTRGKFVRIIHDNILKKNKKKSDLVIDFIWFVLNYLFNFATRFAFRHPLSTRISIIKYSLNFN